MDLNELARHIEKIYDGDNNEVYFNNVEFKLEKRKYSNTISPVLYIDGISCNAREMKKFKIQYICRCGRHVIILLQKYMHKERINCMHCLQDRSFEDHVETKPYSLKKGLRNKKEEINITWEEYYNNFKEKYDKTHLLEEEFYNYLPIIYQINDIVLNDYIRKNIIYYHHLPCSNQLKFTSKISFDNGINIYPLKEIYLKCNNCGKVFKIHNENIRKQNIENPLCKQCSFTNELFPIRLYKDTLLTYQSNLEKYFLDKCFEEGINVLNGFEISYYLNGKHKTYITDFYLPDLKIILELKAKNPFYYEDRKSGKIDAKNAAANNFAKENGMDFRFIFEEYLDSFIYECKNKLKLLSKDSII